MTTRTKLFRICVGLQYCCFFGLIGFGIYQSDAFNPRLLFPIVVLGAACTLGTWAILEDPSRRK